MSLNSVSGKSYFFEKINRNAGKNKKPEGGFTGNLKTRIGTYLSKTNTYIEREKNKQ